MLMNWCIPACSVKVVRAPQAAIRATLSSALWVVLQDVELQVDVQDVELEVDEQDVEPQVDEQDVGQQVDCTTYWLHLFFLCSAIYWTLSYNVMQYIIQWSVFILLNTELCNISELLQRLLFGGRYFSMHCCSSSIYFAIWAMSDFLGIYCASITSRQI